MEYYINNMTMCRRRDRPFMKMRACADRPKQGISVVREVLQAVFKQFSPAA